MKRFGTYQIILGLPALVIALLLLVLGVQLYFPRPPKPEADGSVVLTFPEYPIGTIYSRPATLPGTAESDTVPWEELGAAQGRVRIAPGFELSMRVADPRERIREAGDDGCQFGRPTDVRGEISPSILRQLGAVSLHTLEVAEIKLTDDELKYLSGLVSLRSLDLSFNPILGHGLASLRGLANLESLDLRFTLLEDHGMLHLESLPRLRQLKINSDRMTGKGLTSIARMEGLEDLDLGGLSFNLDELSALTSKRVTTLHLSFPHLRAGVVAALGEFPMLSHLEIQDYDWDDDSLADLTRFKNLQSLYIAGDRITDEGLLESIPRFQQLASIRVISAKVTEASLEAFRGNQNLTSLNLSRTSVPPEDLEGLRSSLAPHCDIQMPDSRLWMESARRRREEDRARYPERTIRLPELPGLRSNWRNSRSKGEIRIPAGQSVWVAIDGEEAFDAVAALAPGDIQRLELNRLRPPFDRLARLSHLRLEYLVIASPHIRDGDLAYLAEFDSLQTLDLSSCRIGGAGLAYLESLPDLRELHMEGTYLDDQGLQPLASFPALKDVRLSEPRVTRKGVWDLRKARPELEVRFDGIPSATSTNYAIHSPYQGPTVECEFPPYKVGYLRALGESSDTAIWMKDARGPVEIPSASDAYVSFYVEDDVNDFSFLEPMKGAPIIGLYMSGNRNLIDADLPYIAGLERLRFVQLKGSEITDAGMDVLLKLTDLEWIELSDSPTLTEAGLARLAELPSLDGVALLGAPCTDKALERLVRIPSLRRLAIGGSGITDAGLESLLLAPNLASLRIEGSPITDRGLETLGRLRGLQDLSIFGSSATRDGFEKLWRANPKLRPKDESRR